MSFSTSHRESIGCLGESNKFFTTLHGMYLQSIYFFQKNPAISLSYKIWSNYSNSENAYKTFSSTGQVDTGVTILIEPTAKQPLDVCWSLSAFQFAHHTGQPAKQICTVHPNYLQGFQIIFVTFYADPYRVEFIVFIQSALVSMSTNATCLIALICKCM